MIDQSKIVIGLWWNVSCLRRAANTAAVGQWWPLCNDSESQPMSDLKCEKCAVARQLIRGIDAKITGVSLAVSWLELNAIGQGKYWQQIDTTSLNRISTVNMKTSRPIVELSSTMGFCIRPNIFPWFELIQLRTMRGIGSVWITWIMITATWRMPSVIIYRILITRWSSWTQFNSTQHSNKKHRENSDEIKSTRLIRPN